MFNKFLQANRPRNLHPDGKCGISVTVFAVSLKVSGNVPVMVSYQVLYPH